MNCADEDTQDGSVQQPVASVDDTATVDGGDVKQNDASEVAIDSQDGTCNAIEDPLDPSTTGTTMPSTPTPIAKGTTPVPVCACVQSERSSRDSLAYLINRKFMMMAGIPFVSFMHTMVVAMAWFSLLAMYALVTLPWFTMTTVVIEYVHDRLMQLASIVYGLSHLTQLSVQMIPPALPIWWREMVAQVLVPWNSWITNVDDPTQRVLEFANSFQDTQTLLVGLWLAIVIWLRCAPDAPRWPAWFLIDLAVRICTTCSPAWYSVIGALTTHALYASLIWPDWLPSPLLFRDPSAISVPLQQPTGNHTQQQKKDHTTSGAPIGELDVLSGDAEHAAMLLQPMAEPTKKQVKKRRTWVDKLRTDRLIISLTWMSVAVYTAWPAWQQRNVLHCLMIGGWCMMLLIMGCLTRLQLTTWFIGAYGIMIMIIHTFPGLFHQLTAWKAIMYGSAQLLALTVGVSWTFSLWMNHLMQSAIQHGPVWLQQRLRKTVPSSVTWWVAISGILLRCLLLLSWKHIASKLSLSLTFTAGRHALDMITSPWSLVSWQNINSIVVACIGSVACILITFLWANLMRWSSQSRAIRKASADSVPFDALVRMHREWTICPRFEAVATVTFVLVGYVCFWIVPETWVPAMTRTCIVVALAGSRTYTLLTTVSIRALRASHFIWLMLVWTTVMFMAVYVLPDHPLTAAYSWITWLMPLPLLIVLDRAVRCTVVLVILCHQILRLDWADVWLALKWRGLIAVSIVFATICNLAWSMVGVPFGRPIPASTNEWALQTIPDVAVLLLFIIAQLSAWDTPDADLIHYLRSFTPDASGLLTMLASTKIVAGDDDSTNASVFDGPIKMSKYRKQLLSIFGLEAQALRICQQRDPAKCGQPQSNASPLVSIALNTPITCTVCASFTMPAFAYYIRHDHDKLAHLSLQMTGILERVRTHTTISNPSSDRQPHRALCLLPNRNPATVVLNSLARRIPSMVVCYAAYPLEKMNEQLMDLPTIYRAIVHGDLSPNIAPMVGRSAVVLPSQASSDLASIGVRFWSQMDLIDSFSNQIILSTAKQAVVPQQQNVITPSSEAAVHSHAWPVNARQVLFALLKECAGPCRIVPSNNDNPDMIWWSDDVLAAANENKQMDEKASRQNVSDQGSDESKDDVRLDDDPSSMITEAAMLQGMPDVHQWTVHELEQCFVWQVCQLYVQKLVHTGQPLQDGSKMPLPVVQSLQPDTPTGSQYVKLSNEHRDYLRHNLAYLRTPISVRFTLTPQADNTSDSSVGETSENKTVAMPSAPETVTIKLFGHQSFDPWIPHEWWTNTLIQTIPMTGASRPQQTK